MTQDSLIPTPSAEPEDDVIEVMCRAHDAEDAAQRGEPSPWAWSPDDDDPALQDFATFRADRLAAMRAALSASGLLERERVLREALEPFSAFAQALLALYDDGLPDDTALYSTLLTWNSGPRGRPSYIQLTAADFRRARTALSNPLKADQP